MPDCRKRGLQPPTHESSGGHVVGAALLSYASKGE